MFGMIGKMRAASGKRSELIAILSAGTETMPGCLHYIVMEDQSDPDSDADRVQPEPDHVIRKRCPL